MGWLVLAVLAAAEPSGGGKVAVLVVRRTSVTVDEGRAFAETTALALKAAGVEVEEPAESLRRLSALGVTDPTACSGRKACVLELAKQLEVAAVVSISAAQLGADRSVVLEAWRARDGGQIAKDAVVLTAKAPLVAEHLKAVSSALAIAFPAKKREDAPKIEPAVIEPKVEPKPPPVVVIEPPPPPVAPVVEKSHAATWVTAGLAVAAGVTSVALGASALSARGRFFETTTVGGETVSAHSASEAKAFANSANLQGGIAGGAAALALAFGITAVVVW